jgi:hypothetical protein
MVEFLRFRNRKSSFPTGGPDVTAATCAPIWTRAKSGEWNAGFVYARTADEALTAFHRLHPLAAGLDFRSFEHGTEPRW